MALQGSRRDSAAVGWHLQTLQHRLLCFAGQKLLLKSSSSIFPKFQRKAQSVSSHRAWALLQTQR